MTQIPVFKILELSSSLQTILPKSRYQRVLNICQEIFLKCPLWANPFEEYKPGTLTSVDEKYVTSLRRHRNHVEHITSIRALHKR